MITKHLVKWGLVVLYIAAVAYVADRWIDTPRELSLINISEAQFVEEIIEHIRNGERMFVSIEGVLYVPERQGNTYLYSLGDSPEEYKQVSISQYDLLEMLFVAIKNKNDKFIHVSFPDADVDYFGSESYTKAIPINSNQER